MGLTCDYYAGCVSYCLSYSFRRCASTSARPFLSPCFQQFRSRSRSRTVTPPHWRRELERTVKNVELSHAPLEAKWSRGEDVGQPDEPLPARPRGEQRPTEDHVPSPKPCPEPGRNELKQDGWVLRLGAVLWGARCGKPATFP